MSDYVDLDLQTDAVTLYEDGLAMIEDQAPDGWTPSPVEAWMLSAVARMGVEVAILAGQVPLRIFTYFGESVLRIPALDPAAATGTATFTLTDTLGHTVPTGTQIDLGGVGFLTAAELVVAAGANTGNVAIEAVEPGSDSSGLTGSADLIAPTLVFVDTITVASATTGGTDGETGQEYADRLADELPTLSPKAIYVEDYAILARRDPAVQRALALQRYVPAGPGGTPAALTDEEGAVTVVVHDAGGNDPGATVRGRVYDTLTGSRVRDVLVNVIAPTYTRLDVQFTATAEPGFDAASVEAEAEAALQDFLAPTRWGRGDTTGSDTWQDEPIVYRNNLIGVVENIPGVRRVVTLTLARFGDAQGTLDITLDGPGALPASDTVVNGTVT